MIELDGEVLCVSYKYGWWMAEVELKQDMPENGFRALGTVNLRITPEYAAELTSGKKFLKIVMEIA